ncbi:DUF3592 domain-containing protein [Kordiimonas sp. SCSIO 12610]|uniref:DUF3592 domain-containing protein n=1 Tax=Kordiimonas sp. SCSIO 12610 TaxID=2829597 RepID=UPI0021092BF7|nr:DUF3592 domain-containing protein [Kordiimonas sp. SCSIO 12610]UTW55959.1 hypothetical protein KFF44_03435 [Kordiimonas sp. SCSIO 12610]
MRPTNVLTRLINDTYHNDYEGTGFPEPKTQLGKISYAILSIIALGISIYILMATLDRHDAYLNHSIQTQGTVIDAPRNIVLSLVNICIPNENQSNTSSLFPKELTIQFKTQLGQNMISKSHYCSDSSIIPASGQQIPLSYLPEKPNDIIHGKKTNIEFKLRFNIYKAALLLVIAGISFFHAVYRWI